jgi:hypothetical protein
MTNVEPNLDDDAIAAGVALLGRSGAREFEVGYLHDNVPVTEAGWWARVRYPKGRKAVRSHDGRMGSLTGTVTILAEDKPGPLEAIEDLIGQVLAGGQCTYCHRRVIIDGYRRKWCRWRRVARNWVPGCKPDDWTPPA